MAYETQVEPSDAERELYRAIVAYVLAKSGEKDPRDLELVELIRLVLEVRPAEEQLRRWIDHEV